MRSSLSLLAVPLLLILLHRQPIAVASAVEQEEEDGLFISKVDRPITFYDLSQTNPFDVPQQTRRKSSKSAKAVHVGTLYFGYDSKSAKAAAAAVVRPTLPHAVIQPPPPPPPPKYYYQQQPSQQQYYYNSKPGKGSKSGKSGKSGKSSKSGKYQQYYTYYQQPQYYDPWGRPVSQIPPPPPPKVTITSTTTTTTSTTTTEATTATTNVETTTEATTTTTSASTTSSTEESSTSTINPAETTPTPPSSLPSKSYQCFTQRNELLSAVDRYIRGGCGAEEAKDYPICTGVLETYGYPIGSWCIGPTIDSLSRLFFNRDTFNEDISGWQVGNVTDMWGMFLGAKSFNQDLSTWDISSVRDMTSMFSGATSFHQDLCAWGSEEMKFPYENAEGIFFNTNCTYQENPVMEQGGPFCGSTCGAVIVTTTSTTDAPTDIATTEATTTTTSIPETTTTSSLEAEVSSPTPIPTYSPTLSEHPTALPSMEPELPTYAPTLSEHPTAFPSTEPTDVQATTTSTIVPETTTSIATTSDATVAVSSTITARDEETTTTSTLEATTEATEVGSTSTAANTMTSPATVSTTESSSATSEGGTDMSPLKVTLTYDISNECGLDAEKVMNEVDNTLKEGLIAATTTILQQTLMNENEAAITPKFDGTQRFRMIPPGFRGSVVTPQRYKMNLPDRRRALAQYSDEYPVTIDRILDVETGCDPGTNCLLIISSINVLLDEDDDPDVVKNDITSSILESFDDGRFNDAVPADTVVCPMEEMSDILITAEEDESP